MHPECDQDVKKIIIPYDGAAHGNHGASGERKRVSDAQERALRERAWRQGGTDRASGRAGKRAERGRAVQNADRRRRSGRLRRWIRRLPEARASSAAARRSISRRSWLPRRSAKVTFFAAFAAVSQRIPSGSM